MSGEPRPDHLAPEREIVIEYTNHRREHARRRIVPHYLWWGTTEWHPQVGWLLHAYDVDKKQFRDFAWEGIGNANAETILNDGSVRMYEAHDRPEEPTLQERAQKRLMTSAERAIAAFDFFRWLEERDDTEVLRRFIESGLLDGRKP